MAETDLAGKTVVITGASLGIGAQAAKKLAARGATVAVVGRSPERTAEVARQVDGQAFLADFAKLGEVRKLADQLRDRYPRIDILANNAGGALPRRAVTEDGNELTFQINHLAPFLLTNLLLDELRQAKARVINTASLTYRFARLDLTTVNEPTGAFSQFGAYATTKLANILFTRELARRTAGSGLVTAAFHPGAVATHVYDHAPLGLGRLIRSPLSRPFFIQPDKGADPLVHLATTSDDINGKYYNRFELEEPRTRQAADPELAEQLWEFSARATGLAE
ncbi:MULTISPECIES: SDR family NAD(P)-dependent oxidoreductase [unclassified Nocardia]|uniref:SDR family NAD(P)-dependent oxidoreductase n=1 Tax=unclassified Nocardia TaxID=2637762 RepID=UPI001CE3DA1D|nr:MULTISPECIES: SDR family NAD(P)-dependent oxidoreductase [unclassified Nocardia]